MPVNAPDNFRYPDETIAGSEPALGEEDAGRARHYAARSRPVKLAPLPLGGVRVSGGTSTPLYWCGVSRENLDDVGTYCTVDGILASLERILRVVAHIA
jgi:hypothetical protein